MAASPGLTQMGGVLGIVAAGVAWYLCLAGVVASTFGRPILPNDFINASFGLDIHMWQSLFSSAPGGHYWDRTQPVFRRPVERRVVVLSSRVDPDPRQSQMKPEGPGGCNRPEGVAVILHDDRDRWLPRAGDAASTVPVMTTTQRIIPILV